MIIHFTNINKTNYHLLTELIEHKETMTFDVEYPGPNLEHKQTFSGNKPVNGSQPSSLDNRISSGNT